MAITDKDSVTRKITITKVTMKKIVETNYKHLEGMSDKWRNSFGEVAASFIMLVWGQSGNGKSSLVMQLLKELRHLGSILYVSLEEGFSDTVKANILRSFGKENRYSNVHFTDYTTTLETLTEHLQQRGSERFIIIDSLQYCRITYPRYCKLKERFPKKSFIFISHAEGKLPKGDTADEIRYDAGIKVRVENYIAYAASRYGGNKPYLIWEEGAISRLGKKKLRTILGSTDSGITDKKPRRHSKRMEQEIDAPSIPQRGNLEDIQ